MSVSVCVDFPYVQQILHFDRLFVFVRSLVVGTIEEDFPSEPEAETHEEEDKWSTKGDILDQ